MPKNDQRLSCWGLFRRWCLLLSVLLLALITPASVTASTDTGTPALLLVPYFQRPPVSRYLPSSQRTMLTPALLHGSSTPEFLASDAIKSPEAWDRFIKEAQERASLQLATLSPEMIRDSKGVIQMAVIHTDTPLTASCILLPEFLDHFSAIFGPEILIAIPAQNKIYVFPKLANHLVEMTGTIRDDYLISPIPASTEIFELNRHGLRAVGSLDPNDDN